MSRFVMNRLRVFLCAGLLALGEGAFYAAEESPSLRLITDANGQQLFVDREGFVVGIFVSETELAESATAVPQLPGWPFVAGEVESPARVADIDADGRLEVVFGSLDGFLYAVDEHAMVLPGWPVPDLRTGFPPTLADIDSDGTIEIFAVSGRLAVLRHDGTTLPGWPKEGGFANPAVVDLDGDGSAEIAAMGRNGMAHLWRADGSSMPGWPYVFPVSFARSNKGPAIGDVDGDGRQDIAFPVVFNPAVFVFSMAGDILPGFPVLESIFGLRQGLSMADVDDGGEPEIVFQDRSGLWIVDGNGTPMVDSPIPALTGSAPPAIGDLDGDGRLEIVWGTVGGDARVFAFHEDGTPVAGWPIIVPSTSFNAQATLGDVDGDGWPDVVLGGFVPSVTTAGRIHAWHADATPVAGFPIAIPELLQAVGASAVTITDLDRDGDVELLVGTVTGSGGIINSGRVFAFDLDAPYDPATMEWPTLGHDNQHTARYEPPDRRPVADAGDDRTVECWSPAGALVTLDGSASSDEDSTAGTNDDIAAFAWLLDYGLPGQVLLGEGEILTVEVPLGSHAVTLRVRDRPGSWDTDTVTVTVADTTSPLLSVALDPAELWPPNHRMVAVTATVAATDTCGEAMVRLESIASSEPDDAPGGGDGATQDDIQEADYGTADVGFRLRAERSGAGSGRFYAVTYMGIDVVGNTTSVAAQVVVPHDQGAGVEPLLLSVLEADSATVLEWPSVADAVYTVIRGQVSSLRDAGTMFDLGPVACLDMDTAQTRSTPDPERPEPRGAFFYLVEYHDGLPSGYGTGSAAKERVVPATGGCP